MAKPIKPAFASIASDLDPTIEFAKLVTGEIQGCHNRKQIAVTIVTAASPAVFLGILTEKLNAAEKLGTLAYKPKAKTNTVSQSTPFASIKNAVEVATGGLKTLRWNGKAKAVELDDKKPKAVKVVSAYDKAVKACALAYEVALAANATLTVAGFLAGMQTHVTEAYAGLEA